MKRHLAFTITATLVFAVFTVFCLPTAKAQQSQPEAVVPQQEWTAGQLDNLVAPIALYPDPLLSQMLVASTYPLEVVEAHQWLQRNSNLSGQALVDAAGREPWDPSVQALVATPDALDFLNQDIRWTTDLGDAFLAQQTDVMNAVQRMRARAQADGRLNSTPQQTVTTEDQGSKQVIVIQPASPDVIYVPVYDPYYVWGPPAIGFYPPLYYPTFGFGFGIGYNMSFYFGSWGGWGFWGWTPNWFGCNVYVNSGFLYNYGYRRNVRGAYRGKAVWVHNPRHRQGVPYSSARVSGQYHGNGSSRSASRSGSRYSGAERGTTRSTRSQNYGYRNPARSSSSSSYSSQYRSRTQRYDSGPTVRQFGSRAQPSSSAQQRYRSSPQTSRSPRVLQFRSQAQTENRASSAYRSAPRASARPSGSTINRGSTRGFSRSAGGIAGRSAARSAGRSVGRSAARSAGRSAGRSSGNAGGRSRR